MIQQQQNVKKVISMNMEIKYQIQKKERLNYHQVQQMDKNGVEHKIHLIIMIKQIRHSKH